MDTVIGLGQAGCNIADEFAKHDQYKIYKIDASDNTTQEDWSWASYGVEGGTDKHEKNGVCKFPRLSSPEEYEEKCPNMNNFFRDVKGELLFVIGGAGDISGASLRILEHLKHCDINILYIRPEIELLPLEKREHEWATFNILQEYARSGLFKRLYIVSNPEVEQHLGEIPVIGYYERLNKMIVSTLHMINVYNHNDPVTTNFSTPKDINRISTIGIANNEDGEKKLFYLLDNIEEMRYYYAINKKKLETDGDILKKVREQIKNEVPTGYGIFATKYEQDYVYIIAHTSEIQRQKNEKNT